MRSRLLRVRGLAERYRVDRRLPPQVLQLFKDVGRLGTEDATRRAAARSRPLLTVDDRSVEAAVVQQGSRRIEVVGALDLSLHDLAHRHAEHLVDALAVASIDVFIVDRVGDAFVFGIGLADRSAALDALRDSLGGAGWYLDWEDGSRAGTVPLGDAVAHRHVRHARSWRIYQPRAWGDRAVGRDQAAVLTFWHIGTSGQLELVGTRGQERFDARCPTTVEVIDGRRYPGRTAFPVATGLERVTDPIDIVYTWVDGSDPDWQAAFRSTAQRFGRTIDEVALDPARYHSRDELRYSLRSVWAFCGWARRIHIVTAGQVPHWLTQDERVCVVDHREILPADALPTFNSHAMESSLHHIDGLAEHFVYFNDDMLVGRPIRPETFFTPNGLARVFQSDARVPGVEDEHTLAVDTAARRGRELLAQRFGRVVAHKPLHSPYPLRRSVMADIEEEFTEVVDRTAHSRFRSPGDLSVAASFAQHYALATGRAVLGGIRSEYVHVESGRLSWHLDRIRLGRDFDAFCINETEQRGAADPAGREERIHAFFEDYFPIAAPWESDQGFRT